VEIIQVHVDGDNAIEREDGRAEAARMREYVQAALQPGVAAGWIGDLRRARSTRSLAVTKSCVDRMQS
jgi:hypothetical protein